MDPITHMLTGALVDQGIAKKDFTKQATWIGALSAASPDLDFFVHSDINPLLHLEMHRSFTHSFLFIVIGGLLMTGFFLLLFPSWRPRWKEVLGLSTIAYGTHSLLDACTSYGTQLFWPFSDLRVSWDLLPIIDPVFTVTLLVGTIIAYVRRSAAAARWTLLLTLCYIGFAVIQHQRAMNTQETLQLQRQQTQTTQDRVVPRLLGLYHWDSLYVYHGMVYLDAIHTPLSNAAHGDKNFTMPLFEPETQAIKSSDRTSIERFIWFTQDYTAAVSYEPLILIDLRYTEKTSHPYALWGIAWHFNNMKESMTWMRSVPLDASE